MNLKEFSTVAVKSNVTRFSIPTENICGKYYFETVEGYGEVLCADDSVEKIFPASEKTEAIHYDEKKGLRFNRYFVHSPELVYQDFVEVLAPYSNHLIPPNKWIEVLDTQSDYYLSDTKKHNECIAEIKTKIIEHANKYGFGFTSNKTLQKMVKSNLKKNYKIKTKGNVLFVPQTANTEDHHPNHMATLLSIVLLALEIYNSWNLTGDELIADEVLTDYINQHPPQMVLGREGAVIKIKGYWSCLFWSFVFDERRIKATYCSECCKPVVGTIKATFCSTKCRSKCHNRKYKLEKEIAKMEASLEKAKTPKTKDERANASNLKQTLKQTKLALDVVLDVLARKEN